MAFGPAILDGDTLPDDVAGPLEAVRQPDDIVFVGCGRAGADKSDHRHRGLLRARRERPRCCRAAEQFNELAASHYSITASARASIVGEMAKPITHAVLRLSLWAAG